MRCTALATSLETTSSHALQANQARCHERFYWKSLAARLTECNNPEKDMPLRPQDKRYLPHSINTCLLVALACNCPDVASEFNETSSTSPERAKETLRVPLRLIPRAMCMGIVGASKWLLDNAEAALRFVLQGRGVVDQADKLPQRFLHSTTARVDCSSEESAIPCPRHAFRR